MGICADIKEAKRERREGGGWERESIGDGKKRQGSEG